MVDPRSPIYSELQWLQIHEYVPFFKQNKELIREFSTVVTQNISDLRFDHDHGDQSYLECHFSKILKFDDSQINLVALFFYASF